MHHTDDRAYSDVSLHNKNSLDSVQSPVLTTLEPIKQVGGQLLSANEANVSILSLVSAGILSFEFFILLSADL